MSNALISESITDSRSDRQEKSPVTQLKKSLMRADQQAKFLHLQAEVESLWQQVQRSKNSD